MPAVAPPAAAAVKTKAEKRKEKKAKKVEKAAREAQSKRDKEAAEAAKVLTSAMAGTINEKPKGWKEPCKNGKDCKFRAAGTCKFWHPGDKSNSGRSTPTGGKGGGKNSGRIGKSGKSGGSGGRTPTVSPRGAAASAGNSPRSLEYKKTQPCFEFKNIQKCQYGDKMRIFS